MIVDKYHLLLLPDVCKGAQYLKESLLIAVKAEENAVNTAAITPHILNLIKRNLRSSAAVRIHSQRIIMPPFSGNRPQGLSPVTTIRSNTDGQFRGLNVVLPPRLTASCSASSLNSCVKYTVFLENLD